MRGPVSYKMFLNWILISYLIKNLFLINTCLRGIFCSRVFSNFQKVWKWILENRTENTQLRRILWGYSEFCAAACLSIRFPRIFKKVKYIAQISHGKRQISFYSNSQLANFSQHKFKDSKGIALNVFGNILNLSALWKLQSILSVCFPAEPWPIIVKNLEKTADDQEQYSRRNCLLIHGLMETRTEDTDEMVLDVVNNKLNIEISQISIDRNHSLEKRKGPCQKPRAVIVKFTRYNDRHHVFTNKKLLTLLNSGF